MAGADELEALAIKMTAKIDDLTSKMDAAAASITKIEAHTKEKATKQKESWMEVVKGIAAYEYGVEKAKEIIQEWTDEAIKFDHEMANIKILSGASGEELERFGEMARSSGISLGFTGVQTAQAIGLIMNEGVKSGEGINAVLVPSLELARATGLSAAEGATLVTKALKTFQLSLDESRNVADLFATTMRYTHLNTEELESMLRKAGPTAREYGVSIKDLTILFAGFEAINVDASRGANSYKLAMDNLSKSFDENGKAISKGGKILEEHGITAEKLAALMKNPVEMLKEFHDAGLSAGDAAAIFGNRSAAIFYNLINSNKVLEEAQNQLGGYKKAVQLAQEEMNTADGITKKMSATFAGMGSVLADKVMVALKDFGKWVNSVNQWLKDMTANTINVGNALFGGLGGQLTKLAEKWIGAATASKKVAEQAKENAKQMEEPFKGLQTAAEDTLDMFQTAVEKDKQAKERQMEIEREFANKVYELGQKSSEDRKRMIDREVDYWRNKKISEDQLVSYSALLMKKMNKEVTDDTFKNLTQSEAYHQANTVKKIMMIQQFRQSAVDTNEALKVSAADLGNYELEIQKKVDESIKKQKEKLRDFVTQNVVSPISDSFVAMFKTVRESGGDTMKGFDAFLKTMGHMLFKSLMAQMSVWLASAVVESIASYGAMSWKVAAIAAAMAGVAWADSSFAEGGIVGGPGLAMVGDRPEGPEVIGGLDQFAEMIRPRTSDSARQGTFSNETAEGFGGGGGGGLVLNYNYSPTYGFASQADTRKSAMELIRTLQNYGFRPARA